MAEVQRSLEKNSFSSSLKTKEMRQQREQRFLELSKPKQSKALWACIESPTKWGNQELIRPLSTAALNATSSARVTDLSTPKKDFLNDHPDNRNRPFFVHSVGRSSVILDVGPLAMKGNASARVEELSQPKKINASFQSDRDAYILGCGRTSPIMGVSEAAIKAGERERTTMLASAKPCHKDYQLPRQVTWPIPRSALKGQITDHLERLSVHKARVEGPHRDAEWVVSKQARSAKASNRVQELSQPKKLSDKYQPTRSVEWKIPRSTLRAYATERLQQLSRPIIRDTMDHVQFDPLAFQVKESALKGRIPDRISELSRPIIRS